MSNAFVLFGTPHLVAIAIAFLTPIPLSALARGHALRTLIIRVALTAFMLAGWVAWIWVLEDRGWIGWGNILPMHLCDWANIAIIMTLIRPNPKTYELAYFWTLGGTVQALLTPALAYDFPDVRFLIFFGFHCVIIISLLFLTFGMKLRPQLSSLPRVVVWSVIYFVCAMSVNTIFHTNYGFLAAKPEQPSVLDLLAAWPWYIAELFAIGMVLVGVLYLPWFLWDRFQASAAPSAGTSAR